MQYFNGRYEKYRWSPVLLVTVEPRYSEGPRDCIARCCYIQVLFHIFYYYWGKENRQLYRGLRYVVVRYIEVPLYKVLVILYHLCFKLRYPGETVESVIR